MLSYSGVVGGGLGVLGTGLDRAVVVDLASGPLVLARSGVEGGLLALRFDGAGMAWLLDSQVLPVTLSSAEAVPLTVLDGAEGTFVAVAKDGGDRLLGYLLGEAGIGARYSLSGDGLGAVPGPRYLDAEGFLFAAGNDGALRSYLSDGAGYRSGPVIQDGAHSFFAVPAGLSRLTLAGQDYLVSLCRADPGISVFEIAGNGQLVQRDGKGWDSGLGLFDTPVALATVMVAGRGYALVASAAQNGSGAALSVMEISAAGQIRVTDHILDSQATRFGQVTALQVVQNGDWTYVAVAGGDGGISLFALLPGGQLVHLHSLASAVEAPLGSVATLSAAIANGDLQLLLSSHDQVGFTQLQADLSGQGQLFQAEASGVLRAGPGDDLVMGGPGADRLQGEACDDLLRDGAGQDTLEGGAGADHFLLVADGERDVITDFNPSEDRLDLSLIPMLYGAGQITVSSRPWGALLTFRGEELALYSAGGGAFDLAGIATGLVWDTDRPPLVLRQEHYGSERDDDLNGHDGSDFIMGLGGNDFLRGLAGADELDGGEGNDSIEAGAGQDTVYGGQGRDLIYLGADDDVASGGSQADTIHAGAGRDTVEGGNGRDLVFLDGGDDLFVDKNQDGAYGSDTVYGGAGDDSFDGSGGDDWFFGEDGQDQIFGGDGNDRIFGGDNSDTIHGGAGDDTVFGGNGRDRVYLNPGDDLFADNAQGGTLGRDTVFGGYGNDTIQGGNGDDVFFGQWGDDLIHARLGNDQIFGGDQFDTIHGGAGDDTVFGGNGRDRIYLNPGDDLFADNAQGGALGRDTVFGGYGNDTIEGGNGDDVFYGQWGDDTIFARLGNDSVYGGDDFDFIDAGDGDDLVLGGNGRDIIRLGKGDDVYADTAQTGNLGRDTITGGSGADRFVFHDTLSADVITDFEVGVDRLVLTEGLWGGRLTPAGVVESYGKDVAGGILIDFGLGRSIMLLGLSDMANLADDIILI
ncbi:calcium-binding protein [Thalassovita aquimarina]|uniref:Bifunctional hemolysin/adenylate cyclase n=1 Tax=Thalassovita aquimarina TaxID=2785917 RepID=A0ABS5HNB1_9RHOB|nr:calcium-binding protein [Thalassovita aquimarina]MBR9650103.1 hypothetical protein [Thalassovita aquimarina]